MYDYFLISGITKRAFTPRTDIVIETKDENGFYTKTINSFEINGADFDWYLANKAAGVSIEIEKNSVNKYTGKLRISKNNQRQKVLALDASENNLIDRISANANQTYNILTDAGVSIVFDIQPDPSSIPPSAGYRLFDKLFTGASGVQYDVYVCYFSKTKKDGWISGLGGYIAPYDPTGLLTFDITPTGTPISSDWRIVQPLPESPAQYFQVYKPDLFYPKSFGYDFEHLGILYTNGISLRSAIDLGLQRVEVGLTCVSTFLFYDALESGNSWTRSEVNGWPSTDSYFQLHSVSDIKEPTFDDATRAEISLNQILNSLKVLGCYSFIDKSGKFRIEHVSYKRFQTTIDLRTIYAHRNQICCINPPILEYDGSKMEKKIEFNAVAGESDTYTNTFLEYTDPEALQTETATFGFDNIIVDYLAAIAKSDNIPTDGILMICKDAANEPTDVLNFNSIILNLMLHDANYQYFTIKDTRKSLYRK